MRAILADRGLLYAGAMSFWDTIDALLSQRSVVLGFLIAAGLVLVLTPLTVRLAKRVGGALDEGGDRPRIHTGPIPRIGGIAIVVGILVPALLLLDLDGATKGI